MKSYAEQATHRGRPAQLRSRARDATRITMCRPPYLGILRFRGEGGQAGLHCTRLSAAVQCVRCGAAQLVRVVRY